MNNFTATILPQIFDTPFFGICICILFYSLGVFIRKKTNLIILNPLLTATLSIALFLKITNLPFEKIESGSSILQLFLSPITACLALSIYNQKEILKNNFLPLIAGTFSGALTSIVTVLALCKLFHIEETIVASILSKSVTTPIALALSQAKNGIQAITVLSVVATGITGGILAPKLVSLFRRKNEVALG
ncbi:MAG: LrgB family protein, partial [Treponema sp.]|nr:LrgB family protein [Treponema sp.]